MAEEKDLLEEENVTQPQDEEKAKSMWQIEKESWYDKIPLSGKQLDTIVTVCWILLILTFIVIFLDARGIINPFGS